MPRPRPRSSPRSPRTRPTTRRPGPTWACSTRTQGLTDEARAAYEKAAELDPSDEYGAYSYAQQRISALDEAAESAEEDSADDAGETDDAAQTDAGSDDSTTENN